MPALNLRKIRPLFKNNAHNNTNLVSSRHSGSSTQNLLLQCEPLEQRLMLSTVEVIAAGSTNAESINLQIDGVEVESWDNIGGDAYGNDTVTFEFSTPETVTADQVRIEFTNDLYDPANNVDRNVRIDAIVIDGVRHETEDPRVYSTGTWLPEDGLQPGFRQSEYLTSNGYFQFGSDSGSGSLIEIRARGDEGTEQFTLQIDGQDVRTFDATQSDTTFTWQTDSQVSADQVRIRFTNDDWRPQEDVDANLIVDYIAIDQIVYQTESSDVYSTGTWLPEDGIQPGNRQSEILHTNGYFQYDSPAEPGEFSLTLDSLTVNENVGSLNMVVFRTGGADGIVTVDYTTVSNSVDANDYTPVSGTLTFEDGITDGVVVVQINDDSELEPDESFTLILDNPTGGASLGGITSQTVTIADNDEYSGIVYDEGFEDGFRWTTNPNNTDLATTGNWEVGAPQQTSNGNIVLQTDAGSEGARALITGLSSGASIGTNDIDGGTTTAISQNILLPDSNNLELRFDYYFAHLNNATSDDFFTASIVTEDATTEVFGVWGSETNQAANWTSVSVDLTAFAGQEVQILFSAADAGSGSLVEAGVDQLVIEAIPNQPGVLSFDTTVINVDESAGSATVVVRRDSGRMGEVTVDYTTTAGSATNDDFVSSNGTLTFVDGQFEAQIVVPITDDTLEEQLESFTLALTTATGGATIGTDSQTTITIVDNDNATADFLPDLISVGPTLAESLSIDTNQIAGRTLLRFSSEVGNGGSGPLEIWGGAASGSTQEVFQRIYQEGGGSRDLLAGEFVYHADHGHIHFEGFANYNLRTIDASDTIVASGGKTSFCLINIRQPLPGATADADVVHGRGGNNCGQFQGLSVGYSDVYSSSLPDQWIDITDVADGTYWLEVIADPDNAILESDETNNTARVQVTISNGQVTSP